MKKLLPLLALACCWGPSFLCMKWAIVCCSSITVIMFRLAVASTLLFAIGLKRGLRYPVPIARLCIFSLFAAGIPFTLIATSLHSISSSMAGVLNGTTPLFAFGLSALFLPSEKISLQKMTGLFCGVLGLLFVFYPSLTFEGTTWQGFALMLGASFCYAIAMIYGKKYISFSIPKHIVTFYQVVCSFIIITPIALWYDPPAQWAPTPSGIFGIIFIGCVGTALAFTVYQHILRTAGPTQLSTAVLISPIIAVSLGNIIEGESFAPIEWLGIITLLLGLLLVTERVKIKAFP